MGLLTRDDDAIGQPLPDWRLQPDALRSSFENMGAAIELSESVTNDEKLIPAAVLIGIVTRPIPTVILTVRATHLTAHPGQIAFPGGRCDPIDPHAIATALREAEEEIGVKAAQLEALGVLPAYTTVSSYRVTPVVALLSPEVKLQMNASEVTEVFEMPLSFALNPFNYSVQVPAVDGSHSARERVAPRPIYSLTYVDMQVQRHIWGATAFMLRQLYLHLRDVCLVKR